MFNTYLLNQFHWGGLQELGGCAVKDCYWAHGVEDLDLRAFAFRFPLVQDVPPARHQGAWDRVGKKPLAVKTGKGKGPAAQGMGATAWGNPPRHRSAPFLFLFFLLSCVKHLPFLTKGPSPSWLERFDVQHMY